MEQRKPLQQSFIFPLELGAIIWPKIEGFSCIIFLHPASVSHYVSLYSVCYKVHLGLLSKVYNVCLVSVCYLLSFLFMCVTFPCVTFCDRRNDRHTEQIRLIDYRLTKIANFFRVGSLPFSEFGGNMSVMGVKIDKSNVPVCNSFRPKIIRDQLCYT